MAVYSNSHAISLVVQGSFQGRLPSFSRVAEPLTSGLQRDLPHRPAAPPVRLGNAFRVPPTINLHHSGHGQPLPEGVQKKMESFFAADLSAVRVYVGSQPQSIGAVAFTMGSRIHFTPGHYNPTTPHGQRLLVHELTHVLQQRAGRVRNPFDSGIAAVRDDALEAEADRMVAMMAQHAGTARGTAPALRGRAFASDSVSRRTPAGNGGGFEARLPAGKPRALQPLSFARFSTFGFLSNWGSYNQAENNLLDLLREVDDVYDGLTRNVKRRPAVQALKRQLDKIRGSTINATRYVSTSKSLTRIRANLDRERRRQYLEDRGYPENPVISEIYSGGIDDLAWWGIVSNLPKKSRAALRRGRRPQRLVQNLFKSFCSQGFRYQIMAGGASGLLGKNRDTPEGNCLAYARAFADVLNAYEIEASAKWVRAESEGRFIVRLGDFMDSTVHGHIYHKNTMARGYYMFTSHGATWVPSENKFYDPMAKTSYTLSQFSSAVECELDADKGEVVFYPKAKPKTLYPSFRWYLVRKDTSLPGGFRRVELRAHKSKKMRRW